jgi:hypothetical protein
MYEHMDNGSFGKLLQKELSIQNSCFKHSDLLIVNSHVQKKILEENGIHNVLCIPNGQDLDPYLEFQRNGEHNDRIPFVLRSSLKSV